MASSEITPPPAPMIRLCLGVTGHRPSNAAFAENRERIEAVLSGLFDQIAAVVGGVGVAPVRLHCLLADGVDQIAARAGLAHGWDLVAPLPFGRDLNAAINAAPETLNDADALMAGGNADDPHVAARAASIRHLYDVAQTFELAERDALLARLYREKLAAPADLGAAQAFAARASARAALAGQIMIEQSDIIIGIWDGASRAFIGGTGHTISQALDQGAPVVWIDVRTPEDWQILFAPEALAAPQPVDRDGRDAMLASLIGAALRPNGEDGVAALAAEQWRPRSSRVWTGYRRIEAVFGGHGKRFASLAQRYETPDAIAGGSQAPMMAAVRALPGGDPALADRIADQVLRRFAWSDAISARLSDAYRGGMTANFILSALAVVVGISYQPLAPLGEKWMFAGIEFLLLAAILLITALGGRWRWHGRWFQTRRVAEYLRHASLLLMLGAARSPGRWPKGDDVAWPEYHARHALRSVGLPRMAVTTAYLRSALGGMLLAHVTSQRDYHRAKAERLTSVHHRLDGLSTRLFQLAVVSVAIYLAMKAAAVFHIVPYGWPDAVSKYSTFFGVALPTFGAAIAGIRYFGDFERFAAISDVTATKLDGVHSRITLLLLAPDDHLDYARVSELAHATDEIVVSEIESWQSVFGGKHITVPV